MKTLTLLLLSLGLAVNAGAALQTETLPYRHGEVELEGYLAFDSATEGKRPGVLVIHEWWGLNDFARESADQLAQMGMVALAADMYGKGIRTTDPARAGELSGIYKGNRQLMRDRVLAGLQALKAHPLVDPERMAVIGYCFGGTVALEAARSGAPLRGVVSFHGSLSTPMPAKAETLKAAVLVLHGADDPLVPREEVIAFEEEMRAAGADWQMVQFGGAVHSFTNPAAGDNPASGVAYHEAAARRSWEMMRLFLQEVLEN